MVHPLADELPVYSITNAELIVRECYAHTIKMLESWSVRQHKHLRARVTDWRCIHLYSQQNQPWDVQRRRVLQRIRGRVCNSKGVCVT